MALYPNGVSTCDIAGAVAWVALEDVRNSSVRFPGFPEISVKDQGEEFSVELRIQTATGSAAEAFALARAEAFQAAKNFKQHFKLQLSLKDRVEEAMAQLEHKYGEARTKATIVETPRAVLVQKP